MIDRVKESFREEATSDSLLGTVTWTCFYYYNHT